MVSRWPNMTYERTAVQIVPITEEYFLRIVSANCTQRTQRQGAWAAPCRSGKVIIRLLDWADHGRAPLLFEDRVRKLRTQDADWSGGA